MIETFGRCSKSFLIAFVARSRKRSQRLAMEAVACGEDILPPRAGPAQFKRSLYRFRTAVCKSHFIQPIWGQFHEALGQSTGSLQKGWLDKAGLLPRPYVFQGSPDLRRVKPKRKGTVGRNTVQVLFTFFIVKVTPCSAYKPLI